MSGKDFINVLKNLEIDYGSLKSESFDWLFCKTSTNNILTWLCRYINENNIETDQNLYLTEKIRENGDFFEGPDLNNKITEISKNYPGIFEITSEEIEKLENELSIEEKKEESLEKLTTNYLTLDYKMQRQLGKLERKKFQLRSEFESKKNKCILRSHEIDSEHSEIQKNSIKISKILNDFNNPLAEKNFISQMNINTLKQLDEINKTYFNLWIERRLGLNEALEIISSPSESHRNQNNIITVAKEYYRVRESVYNSLVEKIRAECGNVEVKATKKYLDEKCDLNSSYLPYDPEMEVKMVQIKHNINAFMEEFNILVSLELETAVKKYIENLINATLSIKAKEKYNKYCKLLNKMKMLNNFLLQEFSENYLIDLLFKSEKRKLESSIKILSKAEKHLVGQKQEIGDISQLIENFDREYQIYEETPLLEREAVLKDFLKIASDDFKNTEIKSVLSNVQKRDVLMNQLKENVYNSSYIAENLELVSQVENKIKFFKEQLWRSPTMQPSIIPYRFMENMYELEFSLEKSKENLNRVTKTYKELQNYFAVKWNKEKKLLPVLFLLEPKKLITLIKKLEEHVVAKSTAQDIVVPEGKLLEF